MPLFENNLSPYLTIVEATEPAAPAAGQQRLYIDSTSHLLKATNSSGTDRTIEYGFSGCKIKNNGTQSVNSGSETVISFDTEDYDVGGYHSGGSPTRMTVPTTGKYRLTAICPPAGNAAGATRVTGFRVNGAGYVTGGYMNVPGGGVLGGSAVQFQHVLTCDVSLTAADYVEVFVYQNTGGAINYGDTNTNNFAQCVFSIQYLGT